MTITAVHRGSDVIAVLTGNELVIGSPQEALDLIAEASYHYGCHKMILRKENLKEAFFDLKTGLAGEIMQKFVNYQMPLAIVGRFDTYCSESLQAFIRESNKGRSILFKATEEEALAALSHN